LAWDGFTFPSYMYNISFFFEKNNTLVYMIMLLQYIKLVWWNKSSIKLDKKWIGFHVYFTNNYKFPVRDSCKEGKPKPSYHEYMFPREWKKKKRLPVMKNELAQLMWCDRLVTFICVIIVQICLIFVLGFSLKNFSPVLSNIWTHTRSIKDR